jgi:hypothetical protein
MFAACPSPINYLASVVSGGERYSRPIENRRQARSCLKGTETSDRARDQVLLRARSTCSTSAATMGGSDRPPRGDTCFVNIVGRHRPPCLTSGSQEGSISHDENSLRVPDQPNGARGKPLVRGQDREKLHPSAWLHAAVSRVSPQNEAQKGRGDLGRRILLERHI